MPKPKKQKSPKKPKKAPAKTQKKGKGMHQTVKVSVRVREGAGGGGAAPIVYATYAPTPPAQPTQFTFDDGMPPAPVKRGPPHHRSSGVGADASQPYTSSAGTQVDPPRLGLLPPYTSSDTHVRPRIKIILPRKTPIV